MGKKFKYIKRRKVSLEQISEANLIDIITNIEKGIKTFYQKGKRDVKDSIEISKKVKENAKVAINDIKTGKIQNDKDSIRNLRNVLNDISKGVLMGSIFTIIPGGSIGLIALRKLLKKRKGKIAKILELSVE